MMKKYLFLSVLVIALALVAVACSDNNLTTPETTVETESDNTIESVESVTDILESDVEFVSESDAD